MSKKVNSTNRTYNSFKWGNNEEGYFDRLFKLFEKYLTKFLKFLKINIE